MTTNCYLIKNEYGEVLTGWDLKEGFIFRSNKWKAMHFNTPEQAVDYIYDNELFDCKVVHYGE